MATIVTHKHLKPYRIVIDGLGNYAVEKKVKGRRQADNKAKGYKKGDKVISWRNEGYFSTRVGAFKKIVVLKAEDKFKDTTVDAEVLLEAYKEERKKLESITI